jgi:hypothetical protein
MLADCGTISLQEAQLLAVFEDGQGSDLVALQLSVGGEIKC